MSKAFTPTESEVRRAIDSLPFEPSMKSIILITRRGSNGWNPDPVSVTEFFYIKDVTFLIDSRTLKKIKP